MKKYLLTLATAFALTACSNGVPTPSGDAEKDAKAVIEYMTSEIEQCKTLDDLQKFEEKVKPVQDAFQKYENENPEYKEKFEAAGEKEAAKIQEAMTKKMAEIMGEKK